MRIRLDPDAREPPSSQLASAIAAEVERGRLLPGERVPTVRGLAGQLGLAPNTVAKAYRALEEAGLLVGRRRHGTFVADRLPVRPTDAGGRLAGAADAFARRARQLGVSSADAERAVRRALRRG